MLLYKFKFIKFATFRLGDVQDTVPVTSSESFTHTVAKAPAPAAWQRQPYARPLPRFRALRIRECGFVWPAHDTARRCAPPSLSPGMRSARLNLNQFSESASLTSPPRKFILNPRIREYCSNFDKYLSTAAQRVSNLWPLYGCIGAGLEFKF